MNKMYIVLTLTINGKCTRKSNLKNDFNEEWSDNVIEVEGGPHLLMLLHLF